MAIEVLPPDVHRSGVEFTVAGQAIRFGLLAVKNVGQGAIESIIAAREEGGEFRSLTDFCSRIDLRLTNRKVLEALAKVGALNAFGHPAQILLGLDDALAAGGAVQRDRISGQTSLFEMAAEPAALDAPLPNIPEAPTRERLRWEKELLGLYLSDHPLGEIAEAIGPFVTAWSGDLRDETLDQQRVVVGGIVTGIRMVITKAKATMAIATLEDLQGTIEVVVFPRLFEETRGTWTEGRILLVAGRIDHKGEEVSLLADLAVDWDVAVTRGAEAFARDVAAGDRGRGRGGRPGGNGNGRPYGASRPAGGSGERPPVAVGPGRPIVPPAPAPPAAVPLAAVSPLRPGTLVEGAPGAAPASLPSGPAFLPPIDPGEPVATYLEAPDFGAPGADDDDEPPLPDEARARAADAAVAPTVPVEAGPGQVLHVRFHLGAGTEQAMEEFRTLIRSRPGGTRVVLHVPSGRGAAELPMELRTGVAYDAELLAEVARRLGGGSVDLRLA